MNETSGARRVAVVGGGVAGLTTAAFAARAGHEVTIVERAGDLGGRAATQERDGFLLNQGPHALYRGGAGMEVLRELGITLRGRMPPVSGGLAIARGGLHALPGGVVSMLTTSLLRVGEKIEVGRLLARIAQIDPQAIDRVSLDAWLRRTMRHEGSRDTVRALTRLTSYVNSPDRMSAGVAVRQIQAALATGVLYLDGGWAQLVGALRAAAEKAGARVVTGARAAALAPGEAVVLESGERVSTDAVVLAVPPMDAARISGSTALAEAAAALTPVPSACLDVCLSRLPNPRATFALGIDEPTYFSVHSAAAALAPEGSAMIHVLRYLALEAARSEREDEAMLEGVLDLVQPGWRAHIVHRRFLPRMIATHALPDAARGGFAGRPSVEVPDAPGVYVAGDWVGPTGHLVDASLVSARAAAAAVAPCRKLHAA